MSVYICHGPAMEEIHREAEGERWCFTCRKRRAFFYIVSAPIEPSYYGPTMSVECSEGHDGGDLFPGRFREWSE